MFCSPFFRSLSFHMSLLFSFFFLFLFFLFSFILFPHSAGSGPDICPHYLSPAYTCPLFGHLPPAFAFVVFIVFTLHFLLFTVIIPVFLVLFLLLLLPLLLLSLLLYFSNFHCFSCCSSTFSSATNLSVSLSALPGGFSPYSSFDLIFLPPVPCLSSRSPYGLPSLPPAALLYPRYISA